MIPAERGRGLGRALVEAVFARARGQGCAQFAADTAVDNRDPQAAHGLLGFAEVVRFALFRRDL